MKTQVKTKALKPLARRLKELPVDQIPFGSVALDGKGLSILDNWESEYPEGPA